MVNMVEKACRKCMRIIDSIDSTCELCGSSDLTDEWTGLVIILDPLKSKIAEKMNLNEVAAAYALKVR